MNTSRWICQNCQRSRRTAFCQDCGQHAPDQADESEANLDELRRLTAYLRVRQQTSWNRAASFDEEGDGYDKDGYYIHRTRAAIELREKAAAFKKQADAIEWAINTLAKA